MKKKKIIFFYPSVVAGGAEYLILSLIYQLLKSTNYKIYYIDYDNGFLRKKLIDANGVTFLNYADEIEDIKGDATIVTFLSEIKKVSELFNNNHKNLKILFWSVHPLNYISNFSTFPSVVKKYTSMIKIYLILLNKLKPTQELIRYLISKNSLVFMDHSNYIMLNKIINSDFLPTYLPVATSFSNDHLIKANHVSSTYNLCWIGRLDSDKFNSIKRLIYDFKYTLSNKNRLLYILGNGNKRTELENIVRKLNLIDSVIFVGPLYADRLKSFLIQNVDIGISMGTSSFEFAKLKIPSIIINLESKYHSNDYIYNFLHESYKYNLGIYLDDSVIKLMPHHLYTLNNLIERVHNKNEDIAKKSYEYVFEVHNMDNIAKLFLRHIDKNKLLFHELSIGCNINKLFTSNTYIEHVYEYLKKLSYRNYQ